MTDVEREESEAGRFSQWVHIKGISEEDPDAATKNNGVYTLSYNGDGQLQYLDITIGATTWRKTLSYTSGRLTGISGWVKQ